MKKNKEFYIKVVGAGSKEDIIKELEAFIADLKKTKLSELRNGIEFDTENLVYTTGHPDIYY